MKKSLAKNSVYNVIYKAFNVMFPLISASYLARVLSVSGIGKVSAAQNIAQYFVIIAGLGMGNYGTRSIAKTLDKKETSKVFTELFSINAISTIMCVIAYYLMVLNIGFFEQERTLYIVVGFSIFLNFFNVDWFYQGKEEYGYIMVRSIAVKFISLLALFVFVRNKNDYIAYALINCLATAGNYIFNVVHLRKYVYLYTKELHLVRHLKYIFILLASSIAIELYTMVDTTMLNLMQSEIAVGYYTNAVKIIRMTSSCIIAIGAVALPRLSYYHRNGQNLEMQKTGKSIFDTLILFSVPAAIGIFMLADDIVLVLFGSEFYDSIFTIRILAVLNIVFAVAGGYAAQVLIAANEEKKYLYSVLVGAAINITLNSFLIKPFMQNGAAVASVCAEVAVMSIQLFFSLKICPNIFDMSFGGKIAVQSVALIIVVKIMRILLTNDVLQLIMSVILGAIIYFWVGYIVKNPLVMSFVTAGKTKIKSRGGLK